MTTLFYIIFSTLFVSLLSFSGALTLFLKEKILDRILLFLVTLSAGILIGGAFFHLIPEAILRIGAKEDSLLKIFFFLVLGLSLFFFFESVLRWHHHHSREHPEIMPFSYLILISDALHNFIDGLIIAGSFLIGFPLGATTTLAVALHEIPQEIGDFGILVYGGVKKTKALFLNFLSATTIILGGICGFLFSEKIGESMVLLLPFAAGSFIYVAASDLIPEIKQALSFQKSFNHFFVFLLGLGLMLLIKILGG